MGFIRPGASGENEGSMMSRIELSLLIILGIWIVYVGCPMWLGICVASPAIFLGGGEKDGCDNLHQEKD